MFRNISRQRFFSRSLRTPSAPRSWKYTTNRTFVSANFATPARASIFASSSIPLKYSDAFEFVSKRDYATAKNAGTVQFNLADVGEGIAECEILKWHVNEGQEIQQFDMICEVQSDKATAEITSPYDGLITKLYYTVGDMARVGKPLIDIKVEGAEDSTPEKTETKSEDSTPPVDSSSSASSEGNYENQHYQELQTKSGPVKVLATPAVRHLARQHNIDLREVAASGKEGRILKQDVLAFIDGGRKPKAAGSTESSQQTSELNSGIADGQQSASQAPAYQLEDREVPVKGIKKVMVKSMTAACQIPHFGYCDEIDVTDLKALREQMKPIAASMNVKLSFLPFLIKACSLALKEYPDLNAYTNSDCSSVTLKGSHNIGIAMDTPSGLIVPNIKNVQDLSIIEIGRELNNLQQLGSAGKLEKKHLEGGTFTLSNVGAIGGTYASPVLFLPQVAIGALGKIQTLPRFDSTGNVHAASVMTVSWSADHRVIDGATMARFSNSMKSFLEKPNSMLLAMK